MYGRAETYGDEVGDEHGQQVHGETEDVEERERREGFAGRERLAGRTDEHAERRQRHLQYNQPI